MSASKKFNASTNAHILFVEVWVIAWTHSEIHVVMPAGTGLASHEEVTKIDVQNQKVFSPTFDSNSKEQAAHHHPVAVCFRQDHSRGM